MNTKYFIFDLDDTLMYEIDFLKSAFKEIAKILEQENWSSLFDEMLNLYKSNVNVFELLEKKYHHYTKEDLLDIYRNHFPEINISNEVEEVLIFLKQKQYKIGLLTDGRSITQRNKIKALKLEKYLDKIIISEEFGSSKPNENNFKAFISEGIGEYFYIGDNVDKDFIVPNQLGWKSVCLLDKGCNIHLQNFNQNKINLPLFKINKLSDIYNII